MSDAELVALAVCQAAMGICSDRQFLGLVERVLPGWFPHLPEQSQYNRRLRLLVERLATVQQGLARWLDAGGARLADGTLIGVANYPGCVARSGFAGAARYGYAKSQHHYVYGVRLVLVSDRRGLPLGYTLVPANEKEYEPLAELLTGTEAELLIADKGLWGIAYRARLASCGTALLTPAKGAHARQRAPLALVRLEPARDRERLRQSERPDAPRTPPSRRHRPDWPYESRMLALTLAILLNNLPAVPHAHSPPTTAAKRIRTSSSEFRPALRDLPPRRTP